MRATKVNECGHVEKKHHAHGMCEACYGRWRYQQNHDLIVIQRKLVYSKDPERYRMYQRGYKLRNVEKVSAYKRQYNSLSRARKRGSSTGERISRKTVWERDGGICHICNLAADPHRWHLEHIIPLSKGGAHTYKNVAVSHPACNLEKGAKVLPEEIK